MSLFILESNIKDLLSDGNIFDKIGEIFDLFKNSIISIEDFFYLLFNLLPEPFPKIAASFIIIIVIIIIYKLIRG